MLSPCAVRDVVVDVFISYAKKDRLLVERVNAALQASGFTTWWDDGLDAGDDWRNVIIQRLSDAQAVITLWTSHSIVSRFVIEEAESAIRNNKFVPIRFENIEPPFGTASIHATELRGWDGSASDHRWEQVLRAISRVISNNPMSQNSNFGGKLEKRLLGILPFPRAHVPSPTNNESWTLEKEWSATKYVDGFALLQESTADRDAISYPYMNLMYGPQGVPRHLFMPPMRISAEVFSGNPPGRLLPLGHGYCLYGFDGRLRLYSLCHRQNLAGVTGRILTSVVKQKSAWDHGTELLTNKSWASDEMEGLPSWKVGYSISGDDWRTFVHDFEKQSPLLVLSRGKPGPVRIYHNHREYFRRFSRSKNPNFRELFVDADWVGGEVSGNFASWSADLRVCFIEGSGLRFQSDSGYLLLATVDGYATKQISLHGVHAITLHPSGVLVGIGSADSALELSFYDPTSMELLSQQHYDGLGYSPEDPRFNGLALKVSFSRPGNLLALEIENYETLFIIDLIKEQLIKKLHNHVLPKFSPDGQRLMLSHKGSVKLCSADGELVVDFGSEASSYSLADSSSNEGAYWCPSATRVYLPFSGGVRAFRLVS